MQVEFEVTSQLGNSDFWHYVNKGVTLRRENLVNLEASTKGIPLDDFRNDRNI